MQATHELKAITVEPIDKIMFQTLARFIGLVEEKLSTSSLAGPVKQFKEAIDRLAKNTEASLNKQLDAEALMAFGILFAELKKKENMNLIDAQCTSTEPQSTLGKLLARPLTFPKSVQTVEDTKYSKLYEGVKKAVVVMYKAQSTPGNPFDLEIQQYKAAVAAAQPKPADGPRSHRDIYRQMTGHDVPPDALAASAPKEKKLPPETVELFDKMAAFYELIYERNLEHRPDGNAYIRSIKTALVRLIQTFSEKKDDMFVGEQSQQLEKIGYVLTGSCLKWINQFLDVSKVAGDREAKNVLELAGQFIAYTHVAITQNQIDKRHNDLKHAIVAVCKDKTGLELVSADLIHARFSQRAQEFTLNVPAHIRGPSTEQVAQATGRALAKWGAIDRGGAAFTGGALGQIIGVEEKIAGEFFNAKTGLLKDAFKYLEYGTKEETIRDIKNAMKEMYEQLQSGILPTERLCVDILENFAREPFDPFGMELNNAKAQRYAVNFMIEYRMMGYIKTTRDHRLPLTDIEEKEKLQTFATEAITQGFQYGMLQLELAVEACGNYEISVDKIPGLQAAMDAEEGRRAGLAGGPGGARG